MKVSFPWRNKKKGGGWKALKFSIESAPLFHFQAGYTPLHTACHFGQMNMVRFLLQHGASVNSTTKVTIVNINHVDNYISLIND